MGKGKKQQVDNKKMVKNNGGGQLFFKQQMSDEGQQSAFGTSNLDCGVDAIDQKKMDKNLQSMNEQQGMVEVAKIGP